MKSSSSRPSRYTLHPGFAMEAASIANLQKKTGKTLEEWVQIVKQSGPPTENERAAWLKAEHGMGTNTAGWIAERAEGKGRPEDYDPEALVDSMFAGPKAGLRPVYEELLTLALGIGPDVTASPGKTIVPLYRRHVFAQLKSTTRTRIDLGLALRDTPAAGRLIDTGGRAKGDRITHRIPITSLVEIDEEVKHWLQVAYELDG
jgi:Domain of unknown function (DUF5655)/Domain of unknown function (DUF4287)